MIHSQQASKTIASSRHLVTSQFVFDFTEHPHILSEDVCVALFDGNTEVMHVWFNTNFVDETGILTFNRDEMDFLANQDDYGSAFTMEIELIEIDEEIEDILKEAHKLYYEPHFNDF